MQITLQRHLQYCLGPRVLPFSADFFTCDCFYLIAKLMIGFWHASPLLIKFRTKLGNYLQTRISHEPFLYFLCVLDSFIRQPAGWHVGPVFARGLWIFFADLPFSLVDTGSLLHVVENSLFLLALYVEMLMLKCCPWLPPPTLKCFSQCTSAVLDEI